MLSVTYSVNKDVDVRVMNEHGKCRQDFLKHKIILKV